MEEPPWGEAPLLPAPWSCSHVTELVGRRNRRVASAAPSHLNGEAECLA